MDARNESQSSDSSKQAVSPLRAVLTPAKAPADFEDAVMSRRAMKDVSRVDTHDPDEFEREVFTRVLVKSLPQAGAPQDFERQVFLRLQNPEPEPVPVMELVPPASVKPEAGLVAALPFIDLSSTRMRRGLAVAACTAGVALSAGWFLGKSASVDAMRDRRPQPARSQELHAPAPLLGSPSGPRAHDSAHRPAQQRPLRQELRQPRRTAEAESNEPEARRGPSQ